MAVSAEMAVLEPRWSVGSGLDPIVVNDPADGSVLALLRPSELVQVDEAVSVAAAAQPGWAARSPAERGHFLRLIGDAIRARKTELTALESRENGGCVQQSGVRVET
ncbi:betaine-aldehyde dehydrogenase [Mycobacteroides abscessus subsp. abscessus]|nr:betaine-aldehyde dehydrogenase [Mycobacteroides abscessus subsp. abscessus]SHS74473.1 betaine-aldehyde dehydrogenase [Mycobacteroides abscessus subsp. abscessus]SHS86964.1 betaine-aldehyde dehydrogenase [Mycobacteroides abscessus subsp. abscessus]SHT24337.1 betaine-aldehyde dehydrogenase [Mycobacteroides abscessus subsp. abscessus]SHT38620.1 betaine-aldehyde dehydrogenase [Mycobacteroides abscessus subsp. abscessus]